LEVIYKFDSDSTRWRLNSATSENKKYVFRGNTWNAAT